MPWSDDRIFSSWARKNSTLATCSDGAKGFGLYQTSLYLVCFFGNIARNRATCIPSPRLSYFCATKLNRTIGPQVPRLQCAGFMFGLLVDQRLDAWDRVEHGQDILYLSDQYPQGFQTVAPASDFDVRHPIHAQEPPTLQRSPKT